MEAAAAGPLNPTHAHTAYLTRTISLPFPAPPPPQIHDELVFEVEAAALPAVAARVRGVLEGMAAAHRLRVPLPVKMGAGPSWGELAEYEP